VRKEYVFAFRHYVLCFNACLNGAPRWPSNFQGLVIAVGMKTETRDVDEITN